MNPFSVGLCAPLMSEALLYTSPLPLQTHLPAEKEMEVISDAEYEVHMWN